MNGCSEYNASMYFSRLQHERIRVFFFQKEGAIPLNHISKHAINKVIHKGLKYRCDIIRVAQIARNDKI